MLQLKTLHRWLYYSFTKASKQNGKRWGNEYCSTKKIDTEATIAPLLIFHITTATLHEHGYSRIAHIGVKLNSSKIILPLAVFCRTPDFPFTKSHFLTQYSSNTDRCRNEKKHEYLYTVVFLFRLKQKCRNNNN